MPLILLLALCREWCGVALSVIPVPLTSTVIAVVTSGL
jgi:hypothetical protein